MIFGNSGQQLKAYRRRLPRALFPFAIAFVLAGCEPSYDFRGSVVEPPVQVRDITGTNWTGERFSLAQLRGKVVVIFFGYSSCPDVCPLTLSKMKALRTKLGDRADGFSAVFVSVDPERDTVGQLADYVPTFHPDFFGLNLDRGELQDALAGLAAAAKSNRPPEGEFGGYYTVDHTSTLFVIDQQGMLRVRLRHEQAVDEMHSDIEHLLDGMNA
jgi:protein SCO1/2